MGKKKGRPRKDGERYPSGKLKASKPTVEPIAPALWDRLRTDAINAVNDARLGTEVGRLSLQAELSATQASAAFRIADIYGRYERYKGMRRSAASASYMVASSPVGDDEAVEAITPEMLARSMAEELLEPEQLADLEERIETAEKRFLKLQSALVVFPRNVRTALEMLCVEDRRINPAILDDVRGALEEVSIWFHIKAAPPKEKKKYVEKFVTRDRGEIEIPNPDKAAWLKVLAALRPDLDEPARLKVYAIAVAFKARAIVDRERGKQPAIPSEAFSVIDEVQRHVANLMKKRTYTISARLNEDNEPLTTPAAFD